MTTHPVDAAIIFGAHVLGHPTHTLTNWLAAHPSLERRSMLVCVPSDLGCIALESRQQPGEGLDGLSDLFGERVGALEPSLRFLFEEAPLSGLVTRRVFGGEHRALRCELILETMLSTRGAWLALDHVAPEVPEPVRAFLNAFNTFDGHVGLGWQLGEHGPIAQLTTRRIYFSGQSRCAQLADAVRLLMAVVIADHEGAASWPAFAASTIPKLRPGEDHQALEVRVATDADGCVTAIELDFFQLPTKQAVSLVQSFNLPVEQLERFGDLQGALGVPLGAGGVTWVNRVRMGYQRAGLCVEFGHVAAR